MLHNLDILKRGKPYTIVVFKRNGYPTALKIQFNKLVDISDTIIMLRYHPYNRVCVGGSITVTLNTQFIIWEGYLEPMVDIAVATFHKDDGSSGVKMMKKYSPFNGRYMQRALLSIKTKPIIQNVHPVKVSDRLFDICTVID